MVMTSSFWLYDDVFDIWLSCERRWIGAAVLLLQLFEVRAERRMLPYHTDTVVCVLDGIVRLRWVGGGCGVGGGVSVVTDES